MPSDLTALLRPSERDDWGTPWELFARCARKWGPFDLDAAATAYNAKCEEFIRPEVDALRVPWRADRVWLNPPYGRGLGAWVERAHDMPRLGHCTRVVALLPARTDTSWWHRWVMRAQEVVLLKGRIRFEGAKAGAPFPSAVVVWDDRIGGPAWSAMDARIKGGDGGGA